MQVECLILYISNYGNKLHKDLEMLDFTKVLGFFKKFKYFIIFVANILQFSNKTDLKFLADHQPLDHKTFSFKFNTPGKNDGKF